MPQLHDRLTEIARIEHERILSRQATPTIAPNFSPKCAAFERMDAFVCAHELEPQKRREGRRWPTKAARCGTGQDRADMRVLWSSEPGNGVRYDNSMMSSG